MENEICNDSVPKVLVNGHEMNTCYTLNDPAESAMYSPSNKLSSTDSRFNMKNNSIVSVNDSLDDSSQFFEVSNSSYINKNISGVDELIRACADIEIDTPNKNMESSVISDLSNSTQDHTFVSATDEVPLNLTDVILETSLAKYNLNETQSINNDSLALNISHSLPNCDLQITQDDKQERIPSTDLSPGRSHLEMRLPPYQGSKESVTENIIVALKIPPPKSPSLNDTNEADAVRINESKTVIDSIEKDKVDLCYIDERNINGDANINKTATEILYNNKNVISTDERKADTGNLNEDKTNTDNIIDDKSDMNNMYKNGISIEYIKVDTNNLSENVFIESNNLQKESIIVNDITDEVPSEDLDDTITLSSDICMTFNSSNVGEPYEDFKPHRQSTSLSNNDTMFTAQDLELETEETSDDIFKSCMENNTCTHSVEEIFEDPTTFDFLLARGNSEGARRLRTESLYIKFDPLLANITMLPQEDGKVSNDRPNDLCQDKNDEPIKPSKLDTTEIKDASVADAESVRATILELEEALRKQKEEHRTILEIKEKAFEERTTQLQTKITDVIQSKKKLIVVIDEYKRKVKDRANLEHAKVLKELKSAKDHLTSTEDAFNDVHLKYEKLKAMLPVYKKNEETLKESIRENLKTIKSLENRYEQLKIHAMSQLKQANNELVNIRKQQEAETAKAHALLRKGELKINSHTKTIEQKTKENVELQQIIDELIARVGQQNGE